MKKLLAGCAFAVIATSAVHAQETTSSIRGTITAAGAPVSGASVVVTHVPSGTRTTTTTDANGNFTAQGLRIGGPFTAVINAAGYSERQITDINTVIGQPYDVSLDLAPVEGAAAEEVVVTASRLASARTVSRGPVTLLNAEQISKVASVNRDIRDLMRRDPFATLDTSQPSRAVSFAGQNARFNRFTIDGVPVNDSFGLNQDGLPSRRGPVPLDAIAQFQTKVAPFDVREGFFQGGVVNAILRSGTNEFQGTAFYTYSADELVGDRTKRYIRLPSGRVLQPNFKSEDYGFELSGPIIKDKLFFMVSAERVRADVPSPFGTTETNSGTPVNGLTDDVLRSTINAYNTRYSATNPGEILRNRRDKDDRIVAKIDANLSDTQRFAVTGIYTKDSLVTPSNTSSTVLGLSSNFYDKPNEVYAGIAQLNSDWSDTFSTEARGLYRRYTSGQFPIGSPTASFDICTAPTSDRSGVGGATTTNVSTSCPSGTPRVIIGPGGPSQSNILKVEVYGGSLVGRLALGAHNLRVIGEFQDTKVFNQFVNNFLGTYYFDSLADLRAGNAQQLTYQNAPSRNPADGAARFRYQTYTAAIQDDIRISDVLNVSFGARYDFFGGTSRPVVNPNFLSLYGFANNAYISGRGLFQPRFGFDYTPVPRLSIRGGGGIFGGGTPDVYIGNSFSQTGVALLQTTARITDGGVYQLNGSAAGQNSLLSRAILTGVDINNLNPAANQALANTTVGATTSVNALSPDFKIPSQWRATLSADYRLDLGGLGDGWNFGVDGFFSKVRDQVLVTDIRSQALAGVGSTTPDGRQRYVGLRGNGDNNQDLLLTNTGKGRSWVGVVRFDKRWDLGISVGGSFTYQDVKDKAPLTSSQAGSLYGNVASFDPNSPAYGVSNDQVRYQFKYNVSFEPKLFGDYRTRVDLFGETRIGSPFSYTFQDLAGGRNGTFGTAGTAGRYLFYVPTGINDPLVTYAASNVGGQNLTAAQVAQRIDTIVNNTGLSKYRGRVAPRNAFDSKWFTKIDLHLEQELPAFLGGKSRFSIFGDIENVTNLINHKWGQQLRSLFPYNKVVTRVSCAPTVANGVTNPCGQYVYTQPSNDFDLSDELVTNNGSSLYSVRVGVRFTF